MNNSHKFINFLESITSGDSSLYESVVSGYLTLFEARVLPELTKVGSDTTFLDPHMYTEVFNTNDRKRYMICATDKDGYPVDMFVNFIIIPNPDASDESIWQINFTTDRHSFDVTNTGSLDVFNSAMSLIKLVLSEYAPKYITFKATDSNPDKQEQKHRIYNGYISLFNYHQIETNPAFGKILYERN